MNDERNDRSLDDERLFSVRRRLFGRAGAELLIASRFQSQICGSSRPLYLNWFDARNGVVIANMNDERNDGSIDDERLCSVRRRFLVELDSTGLLIASQSIPVLSLRVISSATLSSTRSSLGGLFRRGRTCCTYHAQEKSRPTSSMFNT